MEQATELEGLRQQYQLELDALRDVRTRAAADHASLSTLAREVLRESHPEVIHGQKELWKAVLAARTAYAPVLDYHSVLCPSEIEKALPERLAEVVPYKTLSKLNSATSHVRTMAEDVRPFVGESLWHRLQSHRAFLGRLAMKAVHQVKTGRFLPWDRVEDGEDEGTLSLCRGVLTPEEMQAVRSDVPGVPQRITHLMETKILDEMNSWIFGSHFVRMNIEQRTEIEKALARAEPSSAASESPDHSERETD